MLTRHYLHTVLQRTSHDKNALIGASVIGRLFI